MEHPDAEKEILIPVGVKRPIRLSAANLPVPLSPSTGYECLLHEEEPPVRIPAIRVDSNTIECQMYEVCTVMYCAC